MKKPLSPRSAKKVDVVIGRRIREARVAKKLSQADLGQAAGVSFQQIQKYEKATNRISASTLFAICQALETPIEGMFSEPATARKR
ncbi:helix-turn-helix domain-containing protein [Tardiphaga robiniae]|uniref:Helix-turn-helix transcriptional regulator n=1 Tax=Tardiphaga robiniae TaxID=943830 RepID=A0A7G6TTD2_9BRAD|nr:helix-turn-helix transcriptional regulator [Tardiphaga robiniae]QND70014.1 helix-turn-helix transcriptional regulator [Tardiphaga robiniae]